MDKVCFCNGQGSGTLICCDYCDTWFHCTCVGIDPNNAAMMDQYICDQCQFINEDLLSIEEDSDSEEDFTLETRHTSTKKSTKRIIRKDNTISEINETCSSKEYHIQRIKKQICKLEQDLLFEDVSPSIHDEHTNKEIDELINKDNDHRMELALSPYPEMASIRSVLKEKQLLSKSLLVTDVIDMVKKPGTVVDDTHIEEVEPYMNSIQNTFHNENPPFYAVPINADIRTFNFKGLCETQYKMTNTYFDCLVMDPPWQLSSANPTRGVAIAYQQLDDSLIRGLPVPTLVPNGFLFIWVINAKYRQAFDMIKQWGFEYIDELSWVKRTKSRRLAKSHGFYLQHSKETCLVAKRGTVDTAKMNALSDVIWAERTGQSQKPTDIYEIIEKIMPKGYFIEIFGRRNNLRNYWVTVGNEI